MPSKNYTLTRVTSGEQDLEWDTNANKYVLASLLAKPEKLYAYTKTIKSKSYYGWGALDEGGAAYYTTSATPQKNDILYIGKGDYYPTYTDDPSDLRHAEFEPVANVVYSIDAGFSAIEDYENEVTYERCIEADTTLPDKYDTIWVNDTTLTPGMVIYDNTGTYTDYRIQDVYAEGFKLDTITITLSASETRRASSGIINGIAFAFGMNGVVEPSQIVVPKNKECTISLVNGFGSDIYLDGELLANIEPGVETLTTSFTPTKDCALEFIVYSGGGYPGQD